MRLESLLPHSAAPLRMLAFSQTAVIVAAQGARGSRMGSTAFNVLKSRVAPRAFARACSGRPRVALARVQGNGAQGMGFECGNPRPGQSQGEQPLALEFGESTVPSCAVPVLGGTAEVARPESRKPPV